MIGTTLAHYRITGELGSGGMGEVWRAEDTKLGREVALKVLPAEFVDDEARLERFEREARAVAALNHPSIVTIHSVEEADGHRFLTMELVEGKTLEEVIPDGGMALSALLETATPMAEAIAAAHDKGVVHRDLKPQNVMVDDHGRVKVLDFGLAKLQEASDGTDVAEAATEALTGIGMIVGTVPYMSPEQIESLAVDHRTDIFSLGVLLYEMATGERPFAGKSQPALMSSILKDVPTSVVEMRTDLPRHLGRVIGRCLEKDRRDRYQTARDVFNELKTLKRETSGESVAPVSRPAPPSVVRTSRSRTIAVMPFRAPAGAPALTSLAEGLAEEIAAGLARFPYLTIVDGVQLGLSESSTEFIRRHDVRYLLRSGLRSAGPEFRLSVQLVDAESGAHLWSETYDRRLEGESLFELQDDLTDRIVATVGDYSGVMARLVASELRAMNDDEMTTDDWIMRAVCFVQVIQPPEEHAIIRDGLEAAVAKDRDNAEAHAWLANAYTNEFSFGFNPKEDPLGRSLNTAQRAVDLDPTCQTGWLNLAGAHFFLGDLAAFEAAATRAMALNPRNSYAIAYMGLLYGNSGQRERGAQLGTRACALNPHHPEWYPFVNFYDHYAREEYEDACAVIKGINWPKFPYSHINFAAACGQLGRPEDARTSIEALRNTFGIDLEGVRAEFLRWGHTQAFVEHILDGLRKAGMDDGTGLPQQAYPSPLSEPMAAVPQERGAADPKPDLHLERHTVGRNAELDALRTALDAARGGHGSLVCVAGEPGIGKTTLVEGFLADAATNGSCTIARGRCSERLAGSDAYLPVLEAFDNLLRGVEGAVVARVMKTASPAWYAQIAPPSGDSDESVRLLEEIKDASQERLKREFVAFLREASGSSPLIVFLDDLHWADVSTVDLLSYLGGTLDSLNVLVVVTYRPSDMQLSSHPFLQIKPDLQTRGLSRELRLEFLRESEVADYLALEFPDHGFPREFPALIHERTEGSPLFMADLVRYLEENGSIAKVDGRWTLEHGLPEIERELPESVRAMIERKIERLNPDDLELLTVASVQGYIFDSAVVTGVLGHSANDVEERLENLDRVHALVELSSETELPDHTLNLRYRFVHVLYQNALYGSLRATRRATLCRAVGRTLEGFHGDKTPGVAHELAALFESGRDFARAARYYLLAAGQAGEVFADREAATLAARGIQQVGKLDASPERAQRELELQLALGQALRTTKGYGHPDTGNVYARARELCHDIGEAPQLFPVLFGLWEFHQNQGELASAVEVGEQMLALAETVHEPGLLVAAHAVMADNLLCIGEQVTARKHAAQAVALYDPGQHQSLAAMSGYDSGVAAHSMAAVALWQAGFPDQAIKSCNIAFDLAEDLSHPCTQVFGALFASWIQNWVGGLEVAREMADRSVEIATEYDIPALVALGRVYQGWASIANGEVEAGTELARKGVDGLQASGFIWARSVYLGVVAEGCAEAGRIDEALAILEEAFEHVERTGERFHEAELHRLKGECLLRSASHADPLEAERCFMSAIEIAERQKAMSWVLRATTSLARLWQEQGRLAEVHERLERVYSWFTEGFDTSDLRAAKTLLEELAAAMAAEPGLANADEGFRRPAETKSIVVLPFANLSPDPDTEYFSDGLTDEIITDLSRVRALRVISRSSAMRLKGDERGLAAISRDLDCRYVLEGSVRRAANTVRITARLVDAQNDDQLWADKYGGTLDDVFDIQERVSRSIVDALEIRLTPHEAEQLSERPIPDVRAQECYLRARGEIWSFLPGGVDKAISHLEAGLALVGDNALLYQGLGEAYFQAINIGAAGGREEEFITKAELCAEKIFALEPESPRGSSIRAHLQLARGDVHGSRGSWRRVLQAYPRDVQALQLSAHILGWLGGKPDAAAPLVARLLDIDPLDPMSRLMSATVPLFAGRFSEAIEPGRRMFELDPVTPVWRANFVMVLAYNQELDEAEALTEGLVAQPDSDVGTWWMGICRAAWREDRAEVVRLADGPYQQAAAWDAEIPWVLASAHAAVGAKEEALHWLDRAIDQGMINYPFLSEHDRYLDSIRGDVRFEQAMEKARREWERFDV